MNEIFRQGQGDLPLSREKLIREIPGLVSSYMTRSIPLLNGMVRRGEGKQVIGSVEGRPEDEQLLIDSAGEHMLSDIVRNSGLPIVILGEHNEYDYSNNGKPRAYAAIDSFDNTSQFKRGLDTSPYTVVSFYDQKGNPIAGAVGDIKDQRVYFAVNGQTFIRDFVSGEIKPICRSERRTIRDDNLTLATYLGSNEYSLKFFDTFRDLVADMPPKAVIYAGGGAFIYGLLASGAVDAYVMFDEPRSEIDPGLTLALAAGCTVVSVNPDGSFEDYRFDPKHNKEEVPLFIAACTPELRDEIIAYYLQGKQKQQEQRPMNTV